MAETSMNAPIRSFKDLDAWDAAMTLAVQCYRVSKRLPVEERFELSAQLCQRAEGDSNMPSEKPVAARSVSLSNVRGYRDRRPTYL